MYNKSDTAEKQITIRFAEAGDLEGLRRLAQLDSAVVPSGELLVAHAGSELRAAMATGGREVIADPFHATSEIVGMLALRASQLNGAHRPGLGRRLLAAISGRPNRGSAPQPAGALRPLSERR